MFILGKGLLLTGYESDDEDLSDDESEIEMEVRELPRSASSRIITSPIPGLSILTSKVFFLVLPKIKCLLLKTLGRPN